MTRTAWFLTVALVVTGVGHLAAQAPTPAPSGPAPLTLTAALAEALAANPTVVAARLQRPIDVANIGVAAERPNPSLEYDTERETPRQAISATFPVELGGKRQRRIDLASATVDAGNATLANVMAGVRNDVRRAYFALAAADAQVTLASDLRTLAQRARDAAQTRFSAGDTPRYDVVNAQVALDNAENDLTAAEGERTATQAELDVLLGHAAGAPLLLADSLTSGSLPAIADALAIATRSSTDLAVLDRQIAEEAARREVAKSFETPDIAAGGSFTWDAEPDFGVGWRSSLSITVPLFTKHHAGVVVEDATLAQLRAERDGRAAEIAAAVTAAIARATAARTQMTHYESDILPNLAELDSMAQDSYQAGQTDLVALLAALQSTRDSRQRGLDASLTYQQALADLEKAMGTALP